MFGFYLKATLVGICMSICGGAQAADKVRLNIGLIACPTASAQADILEASRKRQTKRAIDLVTSNNCIQLSQGVEAIEEYNIDGLARIIWNGRALWVIENGLTHY